MTDSRYWSKNFTCEFLEMYKAHPCLWKIKSKDYTNKNLKNAAYDHLVQLCKKINPEANRDYVVKKIQSFRGSFRKELKKVAESQRSGAGREDLYTPSLWYYDALLFTIEQETPSSSLSNIDPGEREEEEEEEEVETRDSFYSEGNEESRHEYAEGNLNNSQAADHSSAVAQVKIPSNSAQTKRKVSAVQQKTDFIDFFKKQLEKPDAVIDEYDAVAMSIGKKLKRMDPVQAIYAEALISKVLTKGLLNQLTSPHFTDISSSDI